MNVRSEFIDEVSEEKYPKKVYESNQLSQSHINTESFDGFFFISGSIWLKNGKLIPGELINCPSNYWLQLSSMRVETQNRISVKKEKTFGRNFSIDA